MSLMRFAVLVLALGAFSAPAFASTSTEAQAAVSSTGGNVVQAQEEKKPQAQQQAAEPDFVQQHFAFTMNENLHPSLEGQLWPFFVGALLPFGAVWLPILVIGNAPDGYVTDALVTNLLHYGVSICGGGIVGALTFFVAGLPGLVVSLGDNFYWMPVNVINTWDRHAKKQGTTATSALPPRAPTVAALGDQAMAF